MHGKIRKLNRRRKRAHHMLGTWGLIRRKLARYGVRTPIKPERVPRPITWKNSPGPYIEPTEDGLTAVMKIMMKWKDVPRPLWKIALTDIIASGLSKEREAQ